jgi:hypothetical protein
MKILFILILPIASILLANEIAYKNKQINLLRLKGFMYGVLDKKPFSCSPCLSFWLSLGACLVFNQLLIAGVEAIVLPLFIFLVNRKLQNEAS